MPFSMQGNNMGFRHNQKPLTKFWFISQTERWRLDYDEMRRFAVMQIASYFLIKHSREKRIIKSILSERFAQVGLRMNRNLAVETIAMMLREQLFDANGKPLLKEITFFDAKGKPLMIENGELYKAISPVYGTLQMRHNVQATRKFYSFSCDEGEQLLRRRVDYFLGLNEEQIGLYSHGDPTKNSLMQKIIDWALLHEERQDWETYIEEVVLDWHAKLFEA